MAYATKTDVSVEKSRAEIETTLAKYGATKFAYMTDVDHAVICFAMSGKMVRFHLPLPDRADKVFWFTPARKNKRTDAEAYREWEQACRSKWRALMLCVKAKLEAVECGITSFEQEFLAHIVMHNGQTIGDYAIPRLQEMSGSPALLLDLGSTGGRK
jgi:hypothetical protein